MHVITGAVGLHQHRLAREVGQDAQLDLGVVGADQRPALLGQEGLADPAAERGSDRNVLQVWIAARQAPGGGDGLVEVGVHPAGFGFHQLGQRLHIGASQLGQGAVLQHQGHHGMVVLQLLQHGGIGAPAGLGAPRLLAVEAQGVEQQLAQLLGGGQVEVDPCGGPGLPLQAIELEGELAAQLLQIGHIDADTGGLHRRQHRLQRQLHLIQQLRQCRPQLPELLPQQAGEPSGEMHVHAAVLGRLRHRDGGEGLPLRHQLLVGGGREAKVALRHRVEPVLGVGVAQIVGQQRVHHHPLQGQAMAHQDQPVVLGVLQGLRVARAAQPGRQGREHDLQGQRRGLGGVREQRRLRLGGGRNRRGQGHVGQIRLSLPPAETDAHQLGAEGVEVGGLRVEGHRGRRVGTAIEASHQGLQVRLADDHHRLQQRQGRRLGGDVLRRFALRGHPGRIVGRGRRCPRIPGRGGGRLFGGMGGEDASEPLHLTLQAVEFELLEALSQALGSHIPQPQAGRLGQRHIGEDAGQLAGEVRTVAAGRQALAHGALERPLGGLWSLEGVEGGVDAVEIAVLPQECGGRLRTYALDTGDVVGAVAREGLEIHHLLRGHPQTRHHLLAPHHGGATVFRIRTATHVEHGDIALVVHQLEEIAIAGKDANPPTLTGRPVGQGAEHVVGLEPGGHAKGQVKTLGQDPLQVGQVGEEHLRRLLAVGLVVGVLLVAEGGLGGVEGHHHPLGREPAAVVEQSLEEAVGDAGGHAVLGREPTISPLGEGVEAAESQRVAVHQQQQRPLDHSGLPLGHGLPAAREPARAWHPVPGDQRAFPGAS